MNEVIIRRAAEEDFPAILQILIEFAEFQRTPEKCIITLEQMRKDKDLFQCLVAVNEGEIIGFSSFFFAYYSWSGKAIYMDDLYIRPGFRNLGLGKRLLNEVIELAKREQCTKLRWQVSRWNTEAIEFYRKMGAVIDEVDINCDLLFY